MRLNYCLTWPLKYAIVYRSLLLGCFGLTPEDLQPCESNAADAVLIYDEKQSVRCRRGLTRPEVVHKTKVNERPQLSLRPFCVHLNDHR